MDSLIYPVRRQDGTFQNLKEQDYSGSKLCKDYGLSCIHRNVLSTRMSSIMFIASVCTAAAAVTIATAQAGP